MSCANSEFIKKVAESKSYQETGKIQEKRDWKKEKGKKDGKKDRKNSVQRKIGKF